QTSGTTAVGNGLLVGSGDFAISGGSITGDAPILTDATVSPSGGSATISVGGTSGLASDVGPNIELDVLGTSGGDASLGAASDLTNGGTIDLESSDSGHGATLDASATVGGSITNTGLIQSLPASGGARHLTGEITNSGVISVLA